MPSMASGILSNSLKRALFLIKLEEGGDHKRWGNVAFHCPILFHRVERCLFIICVPDWTKPSIKFDFLPAFLFTQNLV